MPRINKLIKNIICLPHSSKQDVYTLDEAVTLQNKVLYHLIRRAKFTAFGEHYQFSKIINSGNVELQFKETVPVHTYNDMYVRWWYRSLNGETYVTWPGKMKYFITKKQSGQYTGRTVPVSRAIMSSFLVAGKRYLSQFPDLLNTRQNKDTFKPDFNKTYYGGTLSEILEHYYPIKYHLCLKNIFFHKNKEEGSGVLITEVGVVGIQIVSKDNEYKLIIDNGMYYEFIKTNGKIVSDNKKLLQKRAKTTLTLSQIEDNTNYSLILSNNSGAWRYVTGFDIKFTDIENLRFIVTNKLKEIE